MHTCSRILKKPKTNWVEIVKFMLFEIYINHRCGDRWCIWWHNVLQCHTCYSGWWQGNLTSPSPLMKRIKNLKKIKITFQLLPWMQGKAWRPCGVLPNSECMHADWLFQYSTLALTLSLKESWVKQFNMVVHSTELICSLDSLRFF